MESAEIRRRFIDHFAARDHTVVPSASLIAEDPTLLLVNAGMVPFKPYFLGEQPPPWPRATSVQKCVRTGDIEVVGTTTRHLTFFQMCGNFSFGDYFKEKAIPYAWELLTGEAGYGMDPERLWVTVYLDDDEAADIWHNDVGVPLERIQRRDKADNFWSMTVPGPCGPCSEIYYDRGPEYGREGGPVADEDRYLEVWNLVFMQFERGAGEGYDYPILGELPSKNIDTGLGLERMAVVLQGVDNVYETDLLAPILRRGMHVTGTAYGADPASDVALRVIADHARTATMLVADGVIPSNEGRGYVLRRLLRRVVQKARILGAQGEVMPELVASVRDALSPQFPELASDFVRIETVMRTEEESFATTLRSGTVLFEAAVADARAASSTALPAERAFALHDTYGFPFELTLEMAADAGLEVDEAGFRALMAEQRERSQQDRRAKGIGHADVSAYRTLRERAGATVFTGYDEVVTEVVVRGLLSADGELAEVGAGHEVEVVLDRTPFYAESGGQEGDRGRLVLDGAEVEILDTPPRPLPDLVVHRVRVLSGGIAVGAAAQAEVDVERRRAISRAHTATHLVHRAFRGALGESATQAGSLNAPGRLRFDFHSPAGVPASVLADVEDEINAVLVDDLEVRAFVTDQAEAKRIGALALFGEKYGDEVRVVEVGDYARELCGGTHASRSGQLGVVKLLGEASIGAGVRRVEALVGTDAFRFLAREHVLLAQVAEAMKARPEELPDRIAAMAERLRDAEKELARLRAGAVLEAAAELAAGATDVDGTAVVAHEAPSGTAVDDVRKLALDVRGRLDPGRPAVVVIAVRGADSANLVVTAGPEARAAGLSAGALIAELAPLLGGGGGGKDDLAIAGGKRPDGVPEALALVPTLVAKPR